MQYVQCPIGESFPIVLAMAEDGSIAFVKRVYDFPTIFEQAENMDAVFTGEGFSINGVDFSYDVLYRYKDIPEMRQWLIAQKLIFPIL